MKYNRKAEQEDPRSVPEASNAHRSQRLGLGGAGDALELAGAEAAAGAPASGAGASSFAAGAAALALLFRCVLCAARRGAGATAKRNNDPKHEQGPTPGPSAPHTLVDRGNVGIASSPSSVVIQPRWSGRSPLH